MSQISEVYKKQITWKEYKAQVLKEDGALKAEYQVTRILRPVRYPTWCFITDEFKLTLPMPEGFIKGLELHEAKCSWVSFTIQVKDGRPTVSCDVFESPETQSAKQAWYTIKVFDKWVALDLAQDEAKPNSDEINSNETYTHDEVAIAKFMNEPMSLSRQKRSRSSKKPS